MRIQGLFQDVMIDSVYHIISVSVRQMEPGVQLQYAQVITIHQMINLAFLLTKCSSYFRAF